MGPGVYTYVIVFLQMAALNGFVLLKNTPLTRIKREKTMPSESDRSSSERRQEC
jgi:hypothetical protein